jgi:hypothetical protein
VIANDSVNANMLIGAMSACECQEAPDRLSLPMQVSAADLSAAGETGTR